MQTYYEEVKGPTVEEQLQVLTLLKLPTSVLVYTLQPYLEDSVQINTIESFKVSPRYAPYELNNWIDHRFPGRCGLRIKRCINIISFILWIILFPVFIVICLSVLLWWLLSVVLATVWSLVRCCTCTDDEDECANNVTAISCVKVCVKENDEFVCCDVWDDHYHRSRLYDLWSCFLRCGASKKRQFGENTRIIPFSDVNFEYFNPSNRINVRTRIRGERGLESISGSGINNV